MQPRRPTQFRCPMDLWDWLNQNADRKGISISSEVILQLRYAYDAQSFAQVTHNHTEQQTAQQNTDRVIRRERRAAERANGNHTQR